MNQESITILKRLLTTAKIILPASKVVDRKPGLVPECPGASPIDISFSPNPNADDPSIPSVPYTDVGVDFTITGP